MGDAHLIADDELIERARRLDRDALGELWRIYHPQLLRFLRTKRADGVDDVASQVWIDVGRAIAEFVGGGREFQRWIFTIAHRRSIDEGRRSTRRRETLFDPHDHETTDSGSQSAHSFDVDGERGIDAAVDMMSTIPPAMAEAVMLRVVYEFSVDEAAEVMSTTPANVRVLTHRGLGKLRVRLERIRSASQRQVEPTDDVSLRAVPDPALVRNL